VGSKPTRFGHITMVAVLPSLQTHLKEEKTW
jgi:hypothetical protein